MYQITKENIIPYIKQHMPEFDDTVPVTVSIMGEDPNADEGEGDGHVNYVFKIRTPKGSYVLKQGLELSLHSQISIASYRNECECDTLSILQDIVPEYVPHIIFQDLENHVFMMEFIDNLRAIRFQLIKENQIPNLGSEVGCFLARSSFYTSEYYLPRGEFRKMQSRFENTELRQVMEDGIFLDRFGTDHSEELYHDWERFRKISDDPSCQTNRLTLRRKFMTHSDCLIHSDFHTSNVFLSDAGIKMLDFEFSFMGPFGYDLGYFAGSILAAYCAACFKDYPSEQERKQCKAYLLSTIKMLFDSYNTIFTECWKKDAKKEYQNQDGFLKIILKEMLQDAAGYTAITNWCRTTDRLGLPEYDVIEDEESRRMAMTMAVLIAHQMLLGRERFETIDDVIDMILQFEHTFLPLLMK